MYICEKCGKEVYEKYGSGRFCSRQCANSRTHTQEIKNKISKTLLSRRKDVLKEQNTKLHVIKPFIERGKQLAIQIGLENSPYCKYNTAFIRKQVDNREAYLLCLYKDNKLIESKIVLTYRYIMACKIGRELLSTEIVHHKDGNPENNDIDNLIIVNTSEHGKLHIKDSNPSQFRKGESPWNKGLKNCYSQESIEKMRDSAIKRHKREHG